MSASIKFAQLSLIYLLFLTFVYSKDDFCIRYNCTICTEEKITCRFNRSTNSIDFINPHVYGADFSDSYLEQFVFGDTTLNLHRLNLKNNSIKKINENFSDKMPHLTDLDLSQNKIEFMQEDSFRNLKSLEYFNFSNALSDKFHISRELCELINIRVLDLSFHDLSELQLGCWKNEAHLEEIYLRNAKNVMKSWDNWFPYIGNRLKLIDLSGSDLTSLDSDIASALSELKILILSNNPKLDKSSLFTALKQGNMVQRLERLEISNINASSSNLPLGKLFDSLNSTNITYLDISFNSFNDDLNSFLFNQPKFKLLKTFKGSNNRFKNCSEKLIPTGLLVSLEELDLSRNSIKGKACLLSIKPLKKLKSIDLSNNELSYIPSDLVNYDIASVFFEMFNLTYIDLSHNLFHTLNIYFSQYHTRIAKFDLSHNMLKSFRFMSLHLVNSNSFPMNIYDKDKDTDYDYEDNNGTVIYGNQNEENDDDERFILIDELNLSSNRLEIVNLQHMLQSVRNIQRVDLSRNPIEQVIRLSDEKLLIDNKNSLIEQDELTEILCIDELDLTNCHIKRMPNLEHVCINKISLAYNKLNGPVNLVTSKFTVYFLDYINLQENDVTTINLIVSKQKFKSNDYVKKNSPLHYYLGSMGTPPNVTIHTYIDLTRNRNFKCDCSLIRNLRDSSYIQILNECITPDFEEYCGKFFNRVTITSLNNKIRIVFILTCILLLILSCLIVYFMCSDCFKNLQPFERIRLYFVRLMSLIRRNKTEQAIYAGVGGAGDRQTSKVHYSKLDNELSTSNVNLELNT